MHKSFRYLTFAVCAAGLAVPSQAQTSASGQSSSSAGTTTKKQSADDKGGFFSRFDFGLRVRGTIGDFFYTNRSVDQAVTTKPVGTNNYTTTITKHHMAFGPTVEYKINKHILVSADLLFQKFQYSQALKFTRTSDSSITNTTENTRGTYWDVPIQVRVFKVFKYQPKWMYLTGGGVLREVRGIKTGTSVAFADGTSNYNETPAHPSNSMTRGVSGGFGFRFSDDFGIKLAPEVRYTHFFQKAFNNFSTQSKTDTIEVNVGITF